MFVYTSKQLLADRCVYIFEFRMLVRDTVYQAPLVHMVPEVELVDAFLLASKVCSHIVEVN